MPRIIVLNDPLDARQHNDLGVAYERRGELDLALREYRRAADLDEDWALPLVNLGNVEAARQAWRQAAEYYREALAREQNDAAAMNNLAWALLRQGEFEEALGWSRKAVAEAPADPAMWATLAETRWAGGQRKEALQALDRALALSPPGDERARLEVLGRQWRGGGD